MGRFRPCLLAAAFVVTACQGRPIPMSAIAGTTIALPLNAWAFGSTVARNPLHPSGSNRPDYQRGELVVALCVDANQCGSGVASYYLETLYVTALMPHPASPAALRGWMEFYNYGSTWELTGQSIAFLNIPTSVAPGKYTVSVRYKPYDAPQGVGEVLALDQPGDIWVTSAPSTPPGFPAQNFTPWDSILSGIPPTNFTTQIEEDLLDLIPYPTVLVQKEFEGVAAIPAAAELEVTFDPSLVIVKGVYEDQHTGRGSIVRMTQPAAGRIRIIFLDPRRCTSGIRIAYDLASGRTSPISPAAVFAVDDAATRAYSLSGASIAANFDVLNGPEGDSSSVGCGEI